MDAKEMLSTHPQHVDVDRAALVGCIDACFGCEQACTACADACLGEDMVQNLVRCIRLNLDCADVCSATGRVLSRQTQPDWAVAHAQLQSLLRAVKACGDECRQHADEYEHCRLCGESCRQCEESCKHLAAQIRGIAAA